MTWQRYCDCLSSIPAVGLTLDISRMSFDEAWLESMEPAMQKAFADMAELEKGAIANPDEGRLVGHYWLRTPRLAPTPRFRAEIKSTLAAVKAFAAAVHKQRKYTDVLSIGIGGSALGPMFVSDALGSKADRMRVWFLDNTDPEGIERVLSALEGRLDKTLVLVVSKSGGTPETYNGMTLARAAYERANLKFPKNAVAITMLGSRLDKLAVAEKWNARFPMFDWVGGRTSELSAVGLLAAALQGLDIDGMLEGARLTDAITRKPVTRENPAALIALMWHAATNGRGEKDMVVLPYKDRLLLFSRYLQQLIMESLGKRLDLDGKVVEQGLSVYGNKGSTDQHAYVQQLRDGVNNFFTLFIRVLEDGGDPLEIEPGVRTGDYLDGFYLGTRDALTGNERQSMTITVPRIEARTVGSLIALFERAVGYYATLININAYHQPGVEAGKKAAAFVLELQKRLLAELSNKPRTAAQLTEAALAETAFLILEHLAANGRARKAGASPAKAKFGLPASNMRKVNLAAALAGFSDHWKPRIAGELNGQHVKLVKFQGEFDWHFHENEDELFVVLRGWFTMEYRDTDGAACAMQLEQGEFLIVPRGVEHRPVAEHEVEVLLFEPAGTVNTGNVVTARTVAEPESL